MILIAIEAENPDGSKVKVATGGRVSEAARKTHGIESDSATALSLSLPKDIDLDERKETPVCYVVHIGEAAKLKAEWTKGAGFMLHSLLRPVLPGRKARCEFSVSASSMEGNAAAQATQSSRVKPRPVIAKAPELLQLRLILADADAPANGVHAEHRGASTAGV